MSSDITIVNLTTQGTTNQIRIQWLVIDPHVDGLPYLQFDHAEVRYSTVEGMTDPVVLTDSADRHADHLGVLSTAEYWYQVRAVDRSGQFGPWCDPVLGQEVDLSDAAIATEWVDFSPTVAPASGASTVVVGTCRYKLVGTIVFYSIEFEITSVGTGSDRIVIFNTGLPPCGMITTAAAAYENGPNSCVALIALGRGPSSPSSFVLDLYKYDGSSPIAAKPYAVTGFYEIDV